MAKYLLSIYNNYIRNYLNIHNYYFGVVPVCSNSLYLFAQIRYGIDQFALYL